MVKWALRHVLVSRVGLAVVAISSLSSLLGILAPLSFSRIVDGLAAGTYAPRDLMLFVVILTLGYLAAELGTHLTQLVLQRLSMQLSNHVAERVTEKGQDFFLKYGVAEIQSAISQANMNIALLMQSAFTIILPTFVAMLAAFWVLYLNISLSVAAIVTGYGIFYIALSLFYNKASETDLFAISDAQQKGSRALDGIVQSHETIASFGVRSWFLSRHHAMQRETYRRWVRYVRLHSQAGLMSGLLLAVQLYVNFDLTVPKIVSGETGVGSLILLNMIIFQLNRPFESAGLVIDTIYRYRAALQPLRDLLAFPEPPDRPTDVVLQVSRGEVEVNDLVLSYDSHEPAIEVKNFRARPGSLTVIMGPSGSGKSTVLKAICQLVSYSSGQVLIDGQNIAQVERASLTKVIGFVPQGVAIFSGSVLDNILLGREYDPELLRRACELAGIAKKIDALPMKHDTYLGERGMNFSGGERQRLGIARAIYCRPMILLLDEPTAALDPFSAASIETEIRRISAEVTVIMVAHVMQTSCSDDTVWDLEVEEGMWKRLHRQGSIARSEKDRTLSEVCDLSEAEGQLPSAVIPDLSSR